MDFATLLGPIATGAANAITAAVPIGVPVIVLLIGIGVFMRVLGKFGVKR